MYILPFCVINKISQMNKSLLFMIMKWKRVVNGHSTYNSEYVWLEMSIYHALLSVFIELARQQSFD
jgi:hypothetical protein